MKLTELFKLKPVQFSLAGLFLAGFAAVYFLYWYINTPRDVILISADDFPSELKPGFTKAAVANGLAAELRQILQARPGNEDQETCKATRKIGPQSVDSRKVSLPVPLPSGPTPLFDRELKGFSLNLLKTYAMSARARSFIEIETVGVGPSQYQFVAFFKEKPALNPLRIGNAPTTQGSCPDYHSCLRMLAESVLSAGSLHTGDRLLAYYEGLRDRKGWEGVVRLFQGGAAMTTLKAPEAYSRWGYAYVALERYDDALDKYQRALKIDGTYCPALFQRGYVFLERRHGSSRKEDLAAAKQDFLGALQCDRDDPAIETNLAAVALREWSVSPSHPRVLLQEAERHARVAIRLDPQCSTPAVDLAIIEYRRGQHVKALQDFAELANRFPTSFDVFVNYGFLAYREYLAGNRSSIQVAISQTRRARDLDGRNVIAATNLGYFLYEVDDQREAEEAFRAALRVAPENADALAGLALTEFTDDKKNEAQNLLRKAIAIDPHYGQENFFLSDPLTTPKIGLDLQRMIRELGPH